MTIGSSGNVGIGTTAPSNKLHLKTASASQLKLEASTGSSTIYADSNIYLQPNGTTKLSVLSGGQVNGKVTSSTPSAASVAIDFSSTNLQKITPDGSAGELTLTASNYAAGRTVTLLIDLQNESSLTEIGVPSGWTIFGDDISSSLSGSGGQVLCELTSWGTTEGEVTAWCREDSASGGGGGGG